MPAAPVVARILWVCIADVFQLMELLLPVTEASEGLVAVLCLDGHCAGRQWVGGGTPRVKVMKMGLGCYRC